MSIGRIQAGFAQASQELTVAAANINFDFTLVKVEAPAEYKTVRRLLTPKRVREAEDGPTHVTANRLGALFQGIWPETPNLIKAYGTRASEILEEVLEAESHSASGSRNNWIRTEFGGVDATSIWAAATSNRMLTHSEAISLWAEIVSERKMEIMSDIEKGVQVPMALASAARQEITRDHLGHWDASARAWLQTADTSRQRQYKQFLLIIKNLSIAIHQQNISLFKDVINVWRSALSATEGLISGKPHAVREGPVLLGLSAWHIFPDMLVFNGSTGTINIPMDDPSLEVDGSRLTLDELFLVCIGSLLRRWDIPRAEVYKAIKVIQEINKCLPEGRDGTSGDWRLAIDEPLHVYLSGDKEAALAVSLGRRRPDFLRNFLTGSRRLFGLQDVAYLVSVLKGPDCKIDLLRRLSSRVNGIDNTNSVIVCFDNLPTGITDLQFATVLPHTLDDGNSPSQNRRRNKYHRWIEVPGIVCQPEPSFDDSGTSIGLQSVTEGLFVSEEAQGSRHSPSMADQEPPTAIQEAAKRKYEEGCADYIMKWERRLHNEKVEFLKPKQEGTTLPSWGSASLAGGVVLPTQSISYPWCYDSYSNVVTFYGQSLKRFEPFFGQYCEVFTKSVIPQARFEHVAVYLDRKWLPKTTCEPPTVTLDDVLWCFEHDIIDRSRLRTVLEEDHAYGLFRILGVVGKIYREPAAGGATISGSIVEKEFKPPIFRKPTMGQARSSFSIEPRSAIALIGYLETGSNFIDNMKGDYNIIGLSSGDSIFVRSAILRDPGAGCPNYNFTRILGNIGKPGLSILTSPSNLMVRELNPAAWRVETTSFDGTPLDHFARTSLHLNFTDWKAPLVESHSVGQRDADVNIIEAVVSVRDAGEWVADVDICRALLHKNLWVEDAPRNDVCEHLAQLGEGGDHGEYSSDGENLLSIETWDQVLDVIDGPAVVRCFGSPIARLAILSVLCLHSKVDAVFVHANKTCWKCYTRKQMVYQNAIYVY
ncbi:uncharacterized protein PG998_011858 [Apiospora kogelbergensis]|uniref:uncharacterized protein n=1 Tax=Apiospora kogelbergensis TaxID=1337665 RepID=UPI0031326915